jgi:hypothetical protein
MSGYAGNLTVKVLRCKDLYDVERFGKQGMFFLLFFFFSVAINNVPLARAHQHHKKEF